MNNGYCFVLFFFFLLNAKTTKARGYTNSDESAILAFETNITLERNSKGSSVILKTQSATGVMQQKAAQVRRNKPS